MSVVERMRELIAESVQSILKQQSVICNMFDVYGQARVTKDEEQMLQGG